MRIQDLELISERRDDESYLPVVIFANLGACTHEWRGMTQVAPKGHLCGIAYIGIDERGVPVSILLDGTFPCVGQNHLRKNWSVLNWAPHRLCFGDSGHHIFFYHDQSAE